MRWTSAIAGISALMALAAASLPASAADPRKEPMRFAWRTEGDASWISAQGLLVDDTVSAFEDFVRERDVRGVAMVIDSPGGSVAQAISLGRRLRSLGVSTTVGATVEADGHLMIAPDAACESMCAFLVLGGAARYVPPQAHVRVHQIWMGDRADAPKEASYSADDLMIVQRDVGRLIKYVYDMGGSGDLLAVALKVPPWEDLHEMTDGEIALSGLSNAASLDEVMRRDPADAAPGRSVAKGSGAPGERPEGGADAVAKLQDRFPSEEAASLKADREMVAGRRTAARTAEAIAPE